MSDTLKNLHQQAREGGLHAFSQAVVKKRGEVRLKSIDINYAHHAATTSATAALGVASAANDWAYGKPAPSTLSWLATR